MSMSDTLDNLMKWETRLMFVLQVRRDRRTGRQQETLYDAAARCLFRKGGPRHAVARALLDHRKTPHERLRGAFELAEKIE